LAVALLSSTWPGRAAAQSTGAIAGTVTDAGTGAPLAGIRVDVYNQYGGWVNAKVSDASGAYSVSGLTTGTYYLRTLNAFPYLDELYDNQPCPGDTCTVATGKGVSVTAGETTPGIDFVLQTGGTITGTVTDAITGAPLSNILVGAFHANGASTGGAIGTNLAGVYSIGGLPTGTYYVRTTLSYPYFDELYDNIPCPNNSCSPPTGTGIGVTAGSTTSGIDFGLLRGGTITGTVTAAATGAPRPDVRVDAYTASGELASQAWSNASGVYAIGGLATGTYYVRAWNSYPYLGELYNDVPCPAGNCTLTAGTGVAVTTSATTSGINFGLTLGGTITGTVTASSTGEPIAGMLVSVYTANRESAGVGGTDATGAYNVSGLAPGTYSVRTGSSSGYWNELYDNISCHPDCDVTKGAGVVVSPAATTANINFALDRGGEIAGIVTAAATGMPLPNVQMLAYAAAGTIGGQTVTDASGAYSIPFLDPGTYFLRTVNALPYLDEVYDDRPCPGGSCSVTSGTPVNVTINGITSGINFSLAVDGSITGTVTHGVAGAPLPAVLVTVFSASGTWAGSSSTNASGIYTIAGLPTGTWYVRASLGLPFVDQMYKGHPCQGADCTAMNGTGVSVTSGSVTSGIDFALGTAVRSDFDGDGKSDILWRHESLGEVWQWPMDGATQLSETHVRTISDTAWEIRGLGDQNGDARADLLWRNKVSGQVYVWPMNGTAPSAELYVATVDPSYDIVGTGDLNGDGKADILWRNAAVGDVWAWLMDGSTRVAETYVDTVDPGYRVKGMGDVDGDLKADIVWHGAAGDVWVWLMNGTARLSQTHVGTVPDTNYQIQQVADFDGNGKADLLWHHATRGEVWLWPMDGTTLVSETYVATVPEAEYSIVGNGDYDGDGKADILWHHATRGEVWVWLMNGAAKLAEDYVASVPELEYRIIR
jgi:protocatechuate 3,4-dioxygenase beta subunit